MARARLAPPTASLASPPRAPVPSESGMSRRIGLSGSALAAPGVSCAYHCTQECRLANRAAGPWRTNIKHEPGPARAAAELRPELYVVQLDHLDRLAQVLPLILDP